MNRPIPSALPSTLPAHLVGVLVALLVLLLVFLPVSIMAQAIQEPVDESVIAKLRDEGLHASDIPLISAMLTDVHGPRLTGSPQLEEAQDWIRSYFRDQGITRVFQHAWGPFGKGWTLDHVHMDAVSPVNFPILALPLAWSRGTDGVKEAEVVRFDAADPADFNAYRGKLRGKIVLIDAPRTVEEPFDAQARRRTAEELDRLSRGAVDQPGTSAVARLEALRTLYQQIAFLYDEQPLAILSRSTKGDYGTVFGTGALVPLAEGRSFADRPRPWLVDAPPAIPQFAIAAEQYNRIYRLAEHGESVRIRLDLKVRFHRDQRDQHNLIAELPGTDPNLKDEVVMLGAHLDSWHAGTGATDNAAGSAVMIEAMRLLHRHFESSGIAPRRTIRMGLWSGEEQGLLGSRAYVEALSDAERKRISAYFNLDNGTGRIRGIYLQGNEQLAPLFSAWLAPFQDLEAHTISPLSTAGTDHLAFDAVGIPAFQFIQEPIAYSTRTHHSNMDVYDHLLQDDLAQAATIIASLVYHAAMRDAPLPRKSAPN